MPSIILTTFNAKYSHSALGLRYLYANLKDLKSLATIQEYIITDNLYETAETLLSTQPTIIGLGVYIWNAIETQKLIQIIKKISPQTILILGGPEVSHLPMRVDFALADYIIQGEGEHSFYALCKTIIAENFSNEKIIPAKMINLETIKLPYDFYTDEDIQNRVIYIEASRGCPFHCEFCLSSLDNTVREFDINLLLTHLTKLWERGVRKFKFVDRTFNLNIETTNRILNFFLQKQPPYLLHCEVIPEHFPENLKEKLKQFPPASIQLEIGIQTLNPQTSATIKRKSNIETIQQNLKFLEKETNAHLHIDLIVGLPGECLEDVGNNLNTLVSLSTAEIQIGILKKLSGITIDRHDQEHGMIYSDLPPYEILRNNLITFAEMQTIKRFARFWDLTYNSGNFNQTVRLLWEDDGDVFQNFYAFTEWLYRETQSTWKITLLRLAELIFTYLTNVQNKNKTTVANIMIKDLLILKGRRTPDFLKDYISFIPKITSKNTFKITRRQEKHIP